MDQIQPKPTKVFYVWKYSKDLMGKLIKSTQSGTLEGILDYDADSDSGATGVQNKFTLKEVKFLTKDPSIDVFAVGVSANNEYNSPGFWSSGIKFTVKEAGGIDSLQTEFEILAPTKATTLIATNHLETPSGEIMRVESVTPGAPNYTLKVERGAHGTTPSSVLLNAELELLTPRCGMRRILLTGDTDALDAPVMGTPTGHTDGIKLSWTYDYSDDDLTRLFGWKIYYSTTDAIDKDVPASYDGFFDLSAAALIGGAPTVVTTSTVFHPISAGYIDVDQTFYFAMVAVTKSLVLSDLSNEVSGKVYGTILPRTPSIPIVSVIVTGSYRLKVEAKKSTGTDPALGVMNVKKATIEVYYAATGAGVPTDAAGQVHAGQTFIGTYDDTSLPYSKELGVSATGYKDYWARATFTTGADVVSNWGLSTVFELNAKNNTTDTAEPSGVAIAVLVDEVNPFANSSVILVGITSTGNNDSADQCQIAYRVDTDGVFAAGDTLPFGVVDESRSTPRTFGGYPAVFPNESLPLDRKWEVTARIHNIYGWSDWITPEAITFSGGFVSADTDVCDLASFGAWTAGSLPPGGWTEAIPKPGGEQVTFAFGLPVSNRSTVHILEVYGTTGGALPTETQRWDQGDATLVAVPGGLVATVSGQTVLLNAYAGEFLRIGLDTGKNTTDTLQEFAILSNTAGDPFTITILGNDRIRNINPAGTVTNWEIIEAPLRSLCDFYSDDFNVTPSHLGAIPPRKFGFPLDATGMKFWARTNNRWGKGAKRYSDATLTGTATAGDVVYKIIAGIDTVDLKDAAVTEGKLGDLSVTHGKIGAKAVTTGKIDDLAVEEGQIGTGAVIEAKIGAGAVIPSKASYQLIPIGHDIVFTATDYRSFSWAAGAIYFASETSKNVALGASGNLATDDDFWVSFDPESPGGGLTVTNSVSTAFSGGKVILAIVRTTSVVTEFCTIIPRWGAGANIGAASIICDELSAITADIGSITSGTITGTLIRTAAAGARIEMDSTDGFSNIDGSGVTRVQIPASSSKIVLTSGYNATSGEPSAGWIEFASNFHIIGGVGVLPTTDETGRFLIGSTGAFHTKKTFATIEMVAATSIEIKQVNSSGHTNYMYFDSSGIVIDTHDGDDLTLALGTGSDLLITGAGTNITLNAAGDLAIDGTYTGIGSGITGLNATNISSGTLNTARLPSAISVSTSLTAPLVSCDYLRANTQAAVDHIKIYEPGGTNQTCDIVANNGSDDAGFSAGDGDASVRGFFWARAQTSGTDRAGLMLLENESGSSLYIWADHASPRNLRMHSADPGADDTLGVVVATLPA